MLSQPIRDGCERIQPEHPFTYKGVGLVLVVFRRRRADLVSNLNRLLGIRASNRTRLRSLTESGRGPPRRWSASGADLGGLRHVVHISSDESCTLNPVVSTPPRHAVSRPSMCVQQGKIAAARRVECRTAGGRILIPRSHGRSGPMSAAHASVRVDSFIRVVVPRRKRAALDLVEMFDTLLGDVRLRDVVGHPVGFVVGSVLLPRPALVDVYLGRPLLAQPQFRAVGCLLATRRCEPSGSLEGSLPRSATGEDTTFLAALLAQCEVPLVVWHSCYLHVRCEQGVS